MTTTIRPATLADLDSMMLMVSHSRSVMRANGNATQWEGYPTRSDLQADIECGTSRIIEHDGSAAGTFAVVPGLEPAYATILHGRWVEPHRPYATVHRLAAIPHTHGIAREALGYAARQFDYLRADTHASNHAMRHILERWGFVHCGTVLMDDGSPRLAYEWWRYDEVEASLRAYVEEDVLPQYAHFDAAHREGHARRVIARSMAMARQHGADAAQTFAAAAMHDLGLALGREEHHLHSGTIVRQTTALRRWFDVEAIEAIAQAVEDHRASATTPPRSLLGTIVAEADRDVGPETIVRRTVEYGLDHYPTLDREGHWQRTLQHLQEKYSEKGYIRLWMSNSPNAEPLAELRQLIGDEQQLRSLFELVYTEARSSQKTKY